MKKRSAPHFSFPLLLISAGASFALLGSGALAAAEEPQTPQDNSGIQFGQSYHNDISPALRDLPAIWPPRAWKDEELREANLNPKLPLPLHVDAPDPVVDHGLLGTLLPEAMPAPILNFDGVPFPGVVCSCAPPDTNGAIGATQYVQIVNEGYQVFNKTTGASVLGPTAISAIWSGFGGVCQSNGHGDPVVLYDKIASRWLISQFAGTSVPTDECIAISIFSGRRPSPLIGLKCSPAWPPLLLPAQQVLWERVSLPSCPATLMVQFCQRPALAILLFPSRVAGPTRSGVSTPISSPPLTPPSLLSAVRRPRALPSSVPEPEPVCPNRDQQVTSTAWAIV